MFYKEYQQWGHLMTYTFLDDLTCNSQASCTNVFIIFHSVLDIVHTYIYTQNINYHPVNSVQPVCDCGEKTSLFLSFIAVTKNNY